MSGDRSRAALAALLAGVLAPAAARAFVRTEDACTKVCVYWPSRSVTWVLNAKGSSSVPACDLAATEAAAQASLQAWAQASLSTSGPSCTDLQLVYGGTTAETRVGYDRGGQNENLVVFRGGPCQLHVRADDACWKAHDCANAHDCWEFGAEVIAYTTVTYSQRTGEIYDADMELNDWGGNAGALPVAPGSGSPVPDGYYFTCSPAPGGTQIPALCARYGQAACAYMDAQNTVTHEAGHFVGLDHTPRTTAPGSCGDPADPALACSDTTMYPDASVREIRKRDLSADDVTGLCTIYPAGGPTATCRAQNLNKCLGGCGCGTSGPAGLLALAGIAAVTPRRRRSSLPLPRRQPGERVG
jgi:MYXO-CTERM domain-containing protein